MIKGCCWIIVNAAYYPFVTIRNRHTRPWAIFLTAVALVILILMAPHHFQTGKDAFIAYFSLYILYGMSCLWVYCKFEKEIEADKPQTQYDRNTYSDYYYEEDFDDDEYEEVEYLSGNRRSDDRGEYISLKFVGVSHRSMVEISRYQEMKKGEKVELEKEPDNPYDPHAIKVVTTDGYHIGYIARGDTVLIYKDFDNTATARFYRYDPAERDYHFVRYYFKDNKKKATPKPRKPREPKTPSE